ncbi:hypothetical protein [Haloarchaeobius sp. DFWS5]|uniref:hypothetical protein n=1 Tax=Haloarchaeobius sp. DFWS5 TaxID=3446114 RepID=UPI003EBAE5E5
MADLSKRQYLKYAGASMAALSLGVGGKLAADGTLVSNVAQTTEISPAAKPGSEAAPEPIVRGAASGDVLDYERDEFGSIEFDWDLLSFESDEFGGFEISDLGVDIEMTQDGYGNFESLDMLVEDAELFFDLEAKHAGGGGHARAGGRGSAYTEFELSIAIGDEWIDFEYKGNGYEPADVEFEASGHGDQFEDDGPGTDIEYRGYFIDFEYEEASHSLEIKGAIKLDLDINEFNDVDLDYDDGRIGVDLDTGSLDLEYIGESVAFEWEYIQRGVDDEFEARHL